jgi:DNA repair photolyase
MPSALPEQSLRNHPSFLILHWLLAASPPTTNAKRCRRRKAFDAASISIETHMAFYIRDELEGPVLSKRRPGINELFLSSYTMHIYSGCELGCPYCDGWAYSDRPLNETIRVPLNLPRQLARDLQQIDRRDLIAITALSDPYQPAEQNYRITRQTLQVLAEAGQPCLIMTKSPLILEDISILQQINERSLAIVMTTLVSMDPHLAVRMEGKSVVPGMRLEMLASIKRAGIPVGVAIVPVVPYINDTDLAIRTIMRACAEIEVDFVFWDYLHIPNDRHRSRINELLSRVGSYPERYYQDIYNRQAVVNNAYRAERDIEFLKRCDGLGLEPRAPQRIFAGKLRPENEAALVLKHTAFRDRVQGRIHMMELHRKLADQAYRGVLDRELLSGSPLQATISALLDS